MDFGITCGSGYHRQRSIENLFHTSKACTHYV